MEKPDPDTTACSRCKGGKNPPDQGGTTCLRCYNTGSDPQTTAKHDLGDDAKTVRICAEAAVDALITIARGRSDNGRPLCAEKARDLARRELTLIGIEWSAKNVH